VHYAPIRNSIRLTRGIVRMSSCLPSPDLAPHVLEFWEYEVPPHLPYVPNAIYPSGAVILRFNITERDVEALLYGPSVLPLAPGLFFPHVVIFGVALQVGRAHELIGFSASELRDLRVQLEFLFSPRVVAELKERLWVTRTFEERVRELSLFLRKEMGERCNPPTAFRNAFHSLLLSAGNVDVSQRANGAKTSARTLRRQFDRYVGLGPKEMSRVIRFQRVLAAITGGHDVDFAMLAQRFGYSDQAHLVREFGGFLGVPPGRYLSYLKQLHQPDCPMWAGIKPTPHNRPQPLVIRLSSSPLTKQPSGRRLIAGPRPAD
jgi:AraC-like DNA-binding protein